MISFKASDLHRQAQVQLKNVTTSKKIVLIHATVTLGSTLLFYLIGHLFNLLIADTGGLSGIGTRTVLSTAQIFLQVAIIMALPFWNVGLHYLALRWARNQHTEAGYLLQGFRRLGPILMFWILFAVILLIAFIGLFNICSFVFMLSPFSSDYTDALAPLYDPSATTEQIEALFTPEYLQSLTATMVPLFILLGVVFFLAYVVVFYRLRLGEFAVMDGFRSGGALLHSFRTTKRNWRHLVKLDLHFWWFYALILLCNIIGNGNWLLPYLGIQLPLSETVSYFLFFALGTVLQILVLWQFRGQVLTSYAMLYDTLTQPRTAPVLEQAQ